MMISPKGYYEAYLKDRSVEEIEDRIQELREQIKRLKMTLEAPDYRRDFITIPGEDVQLHLSRLYLEKAKEALVEAGGTHLSSEEELESEAFNDRLDFLDQLDLTFRVFAVSHEKKRVTLKDELGEVSTYRYPIFGTGDPEMETGAPLNRDYFLTSLKDLHMGEWRRVYEIEKGHQGPGGTSWELVLSFKDGGDPVDFFGTDAYPYNFDKLTFLLGMDEDEGEE